jgi:predicted amidohydrolase YtcJ
MSDGAAPDLILTNGAVHAMDAVRSVHEAVAFLDEQTGSIEAGKLADLVVLDRDLTELAPAEMVASRVLLTLSQGEIVHAADGWG